MGDPKKGLVFKSGSRYDFPDGNIVFGWWTNRSKGEGFISQNGQGLAMDNIPYYYGMTLRLRVANTSNSHIDLNVKCSIKKSVGGKEIYSGEENHTVFPRGVADMDVLGNPLFTFEHDSFEGVEGECELYIKAYDAKNNTVYDEIKLYLSFDKGIILNAKEETDEDDKMVAMLTWDGINDDRVGKYRVYKKKASWRTWRCIVEDLDAGSDVISYIDSDYDKNEEVKYEVAAYAEPLLSSPKCLVVSNVATVEEELKFDVETCNATNDLYLESYSEYEGDYCYGKLRITNRNSEMRVAYLSFSVYPYEKYWGYSTLKPGEVVSLYVWNNPVGLPDIKKIFAFYNSGDYEEGCWWIIEHVHTNDSLPIEAEELARDIENMNPCK